MRPYLTNCLCVSIDVVRRRHAYLLLLHELRIRAVVDDILAKDRCAAWGVDLLGIDILDLSVEDKVVASGVQAHRHLATEENEGEDVAILLLVSCVQFGHCTSYTPSSGWRRRTHTGPCHM